MLLAARIGTALFALIGIASGAAGVLGGLGGIDATDHLDNQHRFFAGIWFSVGLGLAYCVPYLRNVTVLFRFLMLALFAGGIARAIGWASYPPDRRMVVAVVIELVFPPILIALQARGSKP